MSASASLTATVRTLVLSTFIAIGLTSLAFPTNAAAAPALTSPTETSLDGTAAEFAWTANDTPVTLWWLYVGSSAGAADIHDSGALGTALTTTVSSLPADGRTLHVRLWYLVANRWQWTDYEYTAHLSANIGPPEIVSPSKDTVIDEAKATFEWAANGTAVQMWWLYVGSSRGASDVHDSGSLGDSLSTAVEGLPTDGRALHVRLWHLTSGKWGYVDHAFETDGGGSWVSMTAPEPGSTLSNAEQTFTWSAGDATVLEWWLYVGTQPGAHDVLDSGPLRDALSTTVSGLPINGEPLHLRLWYRTTRGWQFVDNAYDTGTQTQGGNLVYTGTPILVPNEKTVAVNAGHFEVALTPTSTSGRQGIFAKDGNGYITGGHLMLEMRDGKLYARLQSVDKSYHVHSGRFRARVGETTLARVEFGPDGFALIVNGEETGRADYGGGLGATSGGVGNQQALVIGANNNTSGDGGNTPLNYPFKGEIEVVSTNIIEDPDNPIPRYELTVSGGESSPSGEVRVGDVVVIEADEAAPGFFFDGWTIPDDVEVADASARVTTLTMPARDLAIEARFEARDLTKLEYHGEPILIPHEERMLVGSGIIDVVITPSSIRGTQGIFSKDGYGYMTGGHILLKMVDGGRIKSRIQSTRRSYWLDSGEVKAAEGQPTRVRLAFGPSGGRLLVNGTLVDTNDYGGGLGATSGGAGNEQIAVLGGLNYTSQDGGLTPIRNPFRGEITEVKVSFFGSDPEPEPTYAVAVEGGKADPPGPNLPGITVGLMADEPPANHLFDRWMVEGATVADAESPRTTFVMPANAVKATAVFEKQPTFTVTVTDGTADPAGPNAAGVKVALRADEPPAGMRFRFWSVTDGVELADEGAARTFFEMPAFNVEAKANFERIPTYAVEMVGGVANPAGPNPEGTTVTITANSPPPGQVFARWLASDGVELADATAAQTTFVMPDANVSLMARFQSNTPSDLVYNTDDGPVVIDHDDEVMLQDAGFIDLLINPTSTQGTQTVFAKDGNGFITGGHINLEMQHGKLVVRLQSTERSFRVYSKDFRVPTDQETRVRVDFGSPTGLVLTVNGDVLDTDDYMGGLGPSSGGIGNQQAFVLGANNNTSRDGGYTPLKEKFKGEIKVIDANFLDLGPRYLLTVENGEGDGSYSAGRTVGIAADPAVPGMEFDQWVGDVATVADVNAAATSIVTLDREATVTATYRPLPEGFYTLTVNNGTGGGNFEQGTMHPIAADPPAIGQRFASWSSEPSAPGAFADINASSTDITMPSANTVVAPVYEAILYPLAVVAGTAPVATLPLDGTTTVTADAPPAGMVFVGWLSNTPGVPISTVLDNPFGPVAELTMPLGGVAVEATFATPSTGPTAISLDTPADGSAVDHRGVTLMGRATDPLGVVSLVATVTPAGDVPVDENLSIGTETGQWAVRLFDEDLNVGAETEILLTATNGAGVESTKLVTVMAVDGDKRLHKFVQRAMFGATPEQFAAIRQAERNGTTDQLFNLWLDEQLNPDLTDDPELAALGQPEQIQNGPMNLIEETGDLADIRLRRAIYTRWQLNEVMALFWDNHFNTFASKDGNWVGELNEMDAFRANALGSFYDLLETTTKSPVMMVYLDNAASDGSAGSVPNQNYGREFLELHTVGVEGGYDQDDVETMAALFSGWTVDGFDFAFDPARHDSQDKLFGFLERTLGAGAGQILGRTGAEGIQEAEDAIDLIATHPSTATFICYKLNQLFVEDMPADAVVAACADVFQSSDGDIAAVVRHILTSAAFADNDQHNGKVKSPIEYAAALARNFDATVDLSELNAMVADAGMPQFRQPIPTGWYEDARDWGTGSAMSALWELALEIAKLDAQTDIDIEGLVAAQGLETPQAIAAYLLGVVSGDQFTRAEFDVLVSELDFFGPYVEADFERARDALIRALSMTLVSPSAIQN